MPRRSAKKTGVAAAPAVRPKPGWRPKPFWIALAGFTFCVLVFYAIPLTDANTTQQWDTIDVHYSAQKFFAEELKSFRLPHWSEFAYSGFPFLADPQTGGWYPLNWPFFLAGITPKTLQRELALHVLLALMGAWLLARLWLSDVWSSALVAIAYGFSGFFAGHASHLGMFQTAAWLPLILYGIHISIRSANLWPSLLTGVACACMFLAGHFQTALYAFAAIAVYGAIVAALENRWAAAIRVLLLCAALTVLLSAIQWLPTLELVGESARAGVLFRNQTNAPLEARAFWTLLSPNHYGSVRGEYTGPADQTQFYFYAGFLVLPLAVIGAASGRVRWVALALIVPFAWYAFGPAGGLYRLITLLPGFALVRAPVHAWFVVALGLALLAGAGLTRLTARVRFKLLALIAGVATFCDVFYWNSLANELAYYRGSFESHYGSFEDSFARAAHASLPPGTRLYAPRATAAFGPLNSSYDVRVPVTYGYSPLPLRRYLEYLDAAAANPKLLDALNVGLSVAADASTAERHPGVLPKFFFPKRLTPVPDPTNSARLLASANPIESATVEGDLGGLSQDGSAAVTVVSSNPEQYALRCETKSASLLRAAIPWYPAWSAKMDGRPVPTRIVNHAMIGIPIPAGRHEVVLEYNPVRFELGAALSVMTASALIAAAVFARLRAGRRGP